LSSSLSLLVSRFRDTDVGSMAEELVVHGFNGWRGFWHSTEMAIMRGVDFDLVSNY